jgi:hypothetical protein
MGEYGQASAPAAKRYVMPIALTAIFLEFPGT